MPPTQGDQTITSDHFGCVGNTIRLRSDRYFDISDPQPADITLRDIAGALSKLCRFGGHCDQFYSVAEHSVHCEEIANRDGLSKAAKLAVLFHDAAEAFIGDCVKPLKIMLPEYSVIEKRIEAVIGERFGIDFETHHADVQRIDREMLIAERRALFTEDDCVWAGENAVRDVLVPLKMWHPNAAEWRFIYAASELGVSE